jgi:uncharacterized protein YuzE
LRAEWDPTGALYVNLEPAGQEDEIDVARTVDLGRGVLVDVDADGRALGVEVLGTFVDLPDEASQNPRYAIKSGGRILTEEDIDRYAAEAEKGYDPDRLVARSRDKPSDKEK